MQNAAGEVAKLAKGSGEVVWQFNMLERFESANLVWGVSESPLVVGERLFVTPGGEAGTYAALSTADGATENRVP